MGPPTARAWVIGHPRNNWKQLAALGRIITQWPTKEGAVQKQKPGARRALGIP